MARIAAILTAIGRAVRRDVGSFESLYVNNVFFFVLLILYAASQSRVEPKVSYPFLLLLLIVMLFPLSSDPLDKVPASRRALWPLSGHEVVSVRIASVLLSPVLWIAIGLMLFRRVRPGIAVAFLTAVVGVQITSVLGRAVIARTPRWSALKVIPRFPGKLGGLVQNHVRQIFQVLDFYVALILVASSLAYRLLTTNPEREAFPILSIMAALAISTYAQCLFGLDSLRRYRLLPLRGWEVLLAKDLAYLGVLFAIVLPLGLLPGLTFGLFALAVGHHASVLERINMRRWRFAGGRAHIGVIQCIGGFILGISAHRVSPAFFFAAVAFWLGSLVLYGWIWEHRTLY